MHANRIKEKWAAGEAVVNGWLHIPSSWAAEVMAHAGWDSLTIDMQHGLADYQAAVPMLQAIGTTAVTPLARVPWNEPGIIGRLLDAGAYGIICPMVNSREACERFVGACRYFPDGYRSMGPTRARVVAGGDYAEHANREILTLAMVETAVAVENVDAIVSVEGLDGVYVGPGDLSLTLNGRPGVSLDDPVLMAALEKILAACRSQGIAAGIHTGGAADARRLIEMGFQLVSIMSDGGLLGQIAQQMVTAVREGGATEPGSGRMY